MDPIIGKGLDKIIEGAADGPIKTLNTTWDLIFGGYHNWVAKKQYKRQQDLENFKANIEAKVKNIPRDNLKEPELSIIGPAIESSKFYISEENIRELFSNLIAAAMDDSKTNKIHHSFVELIKQMSPKDAVLFKSLCNRDAIPAVRYKAVQANNLGMNFLSDVVINNSPLTIADTEIALNNLERIGLLKIDIGTNYYTDKRHYNDFFSYEFIDKFTKRYEKNKHDDYSETFYLINLFGVDVLARRNNVSTEKIYNLVKPACIEFDKGMIEITAFGKAFTHCCF